MAARTKKNDWLTLAQDLSNKGYTLPMPLHVYLGEAVDVARFHKDFWATTKAPKGKPVRPGLDTVSKRLPATTGAEILELVEHVQGAQLNYLLGASARKAGGSVKRGEFLVGEITGALEFLFDDGVEDDKDAQLASVKTAHKDNLETLDGLASALLDYAALGEKHRKELSSVASLDLSLLGEARTVGEELRNLVTNAGPLTKAQKDALATRNGLLQLLAARVASVRAAARWVFRGLPDIARQATSAYERRRRAAARRAAAAKKTATPA
jgi:hypothetical protein